MIKDKMSMNIEEILQCLPHRYPFLLVDKVVELDYEKKRLVARKSVTYNEPFFPGHFPQLSVMPGVLIIEALAQASGILEYKCLSENMSPCLFLLAGVNKARFKKTVVPGDVLELIVQKEKEKGNVIFYDVVALVDENVVCSAQLMSVCQKI